MRSLVCVCLFVCLWSPRLSAAQTVFKCLGANGQTTFQQQPCAGGAAVKVQSNNVLQGERVPDVKPPSKEAGLDDAQVRARYGNPEVINTDIVNGVVKEQYVFRGPGGTTYVYMRDGRSYAVQHRPARRASADATCYSDRDIWNAGVGINSQSLPPGERERREREVERMTANKCSR